MSDKSSIEWLNGGATWNPIRARNRTTGQVGWFCVHASDGCRHCYAEQRNKGFFQIGTRLDYKAQNQEKIEIFIDEKVLEKPLHWKKPRFIFPCSMTDLFGEFHSDEMIHRTFAVMSLATRHTFLLLTKRAERMYRYLSSSLTPLGIGDWRVKLDAKNKRDVIHYPFNHIWLGVSVEDQKTADERIPWLLKTPAVLRWVSYEPGLASINFLNAQCGYDGNGYRKPLLSNQRFADWIVVGGESGPGARPFDIQWARDTIAQCKEAGIPVFYKQGGASNSCTHDRKGGHLECFPLDLQIREFPNAI